jgi:hypothetical protein
MNLFVKISLREKTMDDPEFSLYVLYGTRCPWLESELVLLVQCTNVAPRGDFVFRKIEKTTFESTLAPALPHIGRRRR